MEKHKQEKSVSDRVNARLPEPLAAHVSRMVGHGGYYETPSEYIRDLIRRDMFSFDRSYVKTALKAGYSDAADGRYFLSSGDFDEDMQRLAAMS